MDIVKVILAIYSFEENLCQSFWIFSSLILSLSSLCLHACRTWLHLVATAWRISTTPPSGKWRVDRSAKQRNEAHVSVKYSDFYWVPKNHKNKTNHAKIPINWVSDDIPMQICKFCSEDEKHQSTLHQMPAIVTNAQNTHILFINAFLSYTIKGFQF